MSFADRWAEASAAPLDPALLDTLARSALEEGEEEQALALIAPAARQSSDPHLWHWAGVLQRALDDHIEAFASFNEALRLDPANFAIAYGLARVALEAGWDAVPHFERARTLGPPTSELLLGLCAARFAQGQGEAAAAEVDEILAQSPFWLDGYRQIAQLRALLGQSERTSEALERSIAQHPAEERLWLTLLNLNLAASQFAELDTNVGRAKAAGVGQSFAAFEAIAAGETGDFDRADRLFAEPGAPPIWHIRHLLRTGRAADSLPLIDAALAGPDRAAAWPYAATAWRAVGDPRIDWLAGTDNFVSVTDLTSALPPIDRLAETLRGLHRSSGAYLDQSVRGGTQTDGPLFSRTEPEIRSLREAVVSAVTRYVDDLPARDPDHPLLGPRRDRRVRFAGSWSVRLRGAGFHERHVHNHGWISSALYLALPGGQDGETVDRGTLELGAPPAALGLDQSPLVDIEPAVGRLVLFPSWLWHGTRAFATGERITVAFDVAKSR